MEPTNNDNDKGYLFKSLENISNVFSKEKKTDNVIDEAAAYPLGTLPKIKKSSSTEDLSKANRDTQIKPTPSSPPPEGYKRYPGYSEPVPASYRTLKPKDVVEWIDEFNGSGNVRIFIKQVEEALRHMGDGLDKLCVLRLLMVKKIIGSAKEVICSQEIKRWSDLKEILLSYYDMRDPPFAHLKERRDKIKQDKGETVTNYSRRFLEAHRKVLKAIANMDDHVEIKYLQRHEEREGTHRYLIGLSRNIHMQLESKRHTQMKEGINDALNAETINSEINRVEKLGQGKPQDTPRYSNHKPSYNRNTSGSNPQRNYQSQEHRERRRDLCNHCKKPGHTEDRCYDKLNFREARPSRAPPIRHIMAQEDEIAEIESETESSIEEPLLNDHESTQLAMESDDKSLNSAWEEQDDPFTY